MCTDMADMADTLQVSKVRQTAPVCHNPIINFILRDLPAASLLPVAWPEDIEDWPQII